MHLYLVLRHRDFNLLHIGYRQFRLLWAIVRVPCFGEANPSVLHRTPPDGLALPCAKTDEMVPVEVLTYEFASLCLSKVAGFCALFSPFVTVS